MTKLTHINEDVCVESHDVQPLHNRVLVKRLEQEEKSSGGLFIPEVARSTTMLAKVLAVGPGRWEDGVFTKTAVKPGDIVLVPGIANKFPDWQDGQQILITDKDIGAIVG